LTVLLRCETLPWELGRDRAVGLGSGSVRVSAPMSDVIVKLPLRTGEEAQLFGSFLSKFLEGCYQAADLWAANSDAPYIMIHSDPLTDMEMKVVTFQERRVARAFSQGWAQARTTLSAKA
jgi:hypothetical protein